MNDHLSIISLSKFDVKINYLHPPPFGYKPNGLSGHWRERWPSSLHIKHLANSS